MVEQSYRYNNGSVFWNSDSIDDCCLVTVAIRAVKTKTTTNNYYYNVALGFVLISTSTYIPLPINPHPFITMYNHPNHHINFNSHTTISSYYFAGITP